MLEEQKEALKVMENGSPVSINMMGVSWRGRNLRTTFPEELILLLKITLLIALAVTTSLIIYELY